MAQEQLALQGTEHRTFPPFLETHPLYIDLDIPVEPVLPVAPAEEEVALSGVTRFLRWQEKRRLAYEKLLDWMSKQDLPWKSEMEDYLRHQYRRNFQAGTFRHANHVIVGFAVFVHQRGVARLEDLQREHLEAWIENEQDRGMQASTINMRLKALKAWFAVRDPQKRPLFHTTTRDTMTYSAMRAMFRNCLALAGLSHKGYGLHCLRHTCASELLNADVDLVSIQDLLGHSRITTTQRYCTVP